MKVLVLASGVKKIVDRYELSPFWLECLQHTPAQFTFEYLPMKLRGKPSLLEVLFSLWWQSCLALVRIKRYDVIISTSAMNGILIAIVRRVFRCTQRTKHVVVDVAMPRIESIIGPRATTMVLNAFKSTTIILCFASRQCQFWSQRLNGQNRSVFIPLGVRMHAHQRRDAEIGNYILVAGRAGRDYAVLWDVVRQVDWPFIVVGGDDDLIRPKGDESVRGAGHRWPGHVKLYNEIPYMEYVSFLERCRLVLLPLRDQPFACGQTVLLEAMAAGKAVVASCVAGTEDYIDPGINGLLVPPGSAAEMVRSVRYLLDNPAEIDTLGANARSTVESRYSLVRMGERLVKVLRDLET